jgi:hypothetical protein
VRLWQELNPHLTPVYVRQSEHGLGWVSPFVSGTQASDLEIQRALIDMFNQFGRVVVDAISPKNFIKTPDGKVICVDVGMVLQLEKQEERICKRSGLVRYKSEMSLSAWEEEKSEYPKYFSDNMCNYPYTITTIKALLLIKECRPDIFNVIFLLSQPVLIQKLAQAYDSKKKVILLEAIELFDTLASIAFEKEKHEAVTESAAGASDATAETIRETALRESKAPIVHIAGKKDREPVLPCTGKEQAVNLPSLSSLRISNV